MKSVLKIIKRDFTKSNRFFVIGSMAYLRNTIFLQKEMKLFVGKLIGILSEVVIECRRAPVRRLYLWKSSEYCIIQLLVCFRRKMLHIEVFRYPISDTESFMLAFFLRKEIGY